MKTTHGTDIVMCVMERKRPALSIIINIIIWLVFSINGAIENLQYNLQELPTK